MAENMKLEKVDRTNAKLPKNVLNILVPVKTISPALVGLAIPL